jgi:Tfp pilus assembly PilM family ATPase
MASHSAVAIGVSRRRLWAVHGTAAQGRLSLRRVIVEPLPATMAADDPAAVGAWVGRTLHEAGFPRIPVTVALAREQLGLKRITLPSRSLSELPEMTRLAMQRELPFDATSAVIDFLPVANTESSTTVLAVAAPRQVIDFTHRMLRAARFPLNRISVRAMGAAALVRSAAGDQPGGSVLLVDCSGDSIEFAVACGGLLRFARGTELSDVDDPGAMAQAIVTEARRTWMSYRIVESAEEVGRAVLMGHPAAIDQAAGPIGEMLQVPVDVLRSHPRVDQGREDLRCAWPLAGLLLEPLLELPSIDLARPRRAPDTGARKRQLVLGGAGLIAVCAVGLSFAAAGRLRDMRAEVETLTTEATAARPQRLRYKRDVLKLEHLERWSSVQADWLGHLQYLTSVAPPPQRLVFDQWSASLDFRGVRYENGSWSAPASLRVSVEGEAADRATADAFRDALVRTDVYAARSSGADAAAGGRRLPAAFTYALESARPVLAKARQERGAADGEASR